MKNEQLRQRIGFDEIRGEIKFYYREDFDNNRHYEINGFVPERVVKKDEDAILKYAFSAVRKARKKWKIELSKEEAIRKNPIPIRVEYKGVLLEGRITEATPCDVSVELDKPCSGMRNIHFGFGSPRGVFNDKHEISKEGYDGAYEALRRAYDSVLRKPVRDLADRLNNSRS